MWMEFCTLLVMNIIIVSLFALNAYGYVSAITDSNGNIYQYEYTNDNLTAVVYPDLTPDVVDDNPRKQYLYENADFPSALTGLIDEEGIRFATWEYDAYGRAIKSKHALGAEELNISYNPDATTTTTNALGKQTTYHMSSVKGIIKTILVTGHQSTHCAASAQSTTYDSDTGFASNKTDWRGNQILLEHNEFGQVTSHTVVDSGTGWTTPIDERVTITTVLQ